MGSSPSTPKKSSRSIRIWLRERQSGDAGDGSFGSTCLRTQLPARSGLNSVETA
jgi:hypothetical protein